MSKEIIHWLKGVPWINDTLVFVFILIFSVISYFFVKNLAYQIIRKIVSKTKTIVDDILLSKTFLRRVSYLAPIFILSQFTSLIPEAEKILDKALSIILVFVFFLSVGALLTALTELYEKIEKFKERPIKGYIQIIKILLYSFMTMMILGMIIGQSIWTIITGLGAFTAVLILVFRDTILNFIASLQISSYDLVRIGDWIEAPKFAADGDVIDISLMIVKVQNFDKTITIIPTYKLIEETFKNWRGMTQSGVRRIKRAIYLDHRTIKFCNKEMLTRYQMIDLIKEFVSSKLKELESTKDQSNINDQVITNISVFREYVKSYLRNMNEISKEFSFQVRQLPSTPEGLPIEIYAYANKTNFIEFEDLQAEIFDHILAVINKFDLEIFQTPSGNDLAKLVFK